MELNEFINKMDEYLEKITDPGNAECDEMYDFQVNYMKGELDKLKENCNGKAEEIACDILEYLIYTSTSGNVVEFVESREMAEEVCKAAWKMYGDYMLEPPFIYEDHGKWAVDCIFGGYFTPGWDAFFDEE